MPIAASASHVASASLRVRRASRSRDVVHAHDCAPRWTASSAAARLAARRSPRLAAGDAPERRLARPAGEHRRRRAPRTRRARAAARNCARPSCRTRSRGRRRCARARCRPRSAAATRCGQEIPHLGDHVAVAGFACMVRGSPCMCIRHTAHRRPRHRVERARRAQRTDVVDHRRAGRDAPRITSGLMVSTETGTPQSRKRLEHRQHARAAPRRDVTGAAPGRLDSPPMSRMSAPSSISCRRVRRPPLRIAESGRRRKRNRA